MPAFIRSTISVRLELPACGRRGSPSTERQLHAGVTTNHGLAIPRPHYRVRSLRFVLNTERCQSFFACDLLDAIVKAFPGFPAAITSAQHDDTGS